MLRILKFFLFVSIYIPKLKNRNQYGKENHHKKDTKTTCLDPLASHRSCCRMLQGLQNEPTADALSKTSPFTSFIMTDVLTGLANASTTEMPMVWMMYCSNWTTKSLRSSTYRAMRTRRKSVTRLPTRMETSLKRANLRFMKTMFSR